MERQLPTAVAALIAALSLASCGGGSGAAEPAAAPADSRAAESAEIERNDGRLGGANTVGTDSPERVLSPGGPLDARRGDKKNSLLDGVGAGAGCADGDMAPSAVSLPAVTAATLCLVNGERADRGLASLAPNAKLAAAASAYAADLVAGSYFSHTGRDGSSSLVRIQRSGYITRGAGYVLGENLAWGTGALATPRSIMQAWMNSDGHRHNILNPRFREFGMGVATGNPASRDGHGATYANEFGVLQGATKAKKSAAAKKRARKARAARKASRR